MIILARFDGIDESVCENSFRRCFSKSRSKRFCAGLEITLKFWIYDVFWENWKKQTMKTKTENLSTKFEIKKFSYGGDDLDILGGILLAIIFPHKKVYIF